jgi:type II secretory pathway pseudopilin PulG
MARPMRSGRQKGFTYVGLLFLLAGVGVLLASVGTVWETAAQREREAELLFIGHQYRDALESYYRRSPGTDHHYPDQLESLLLDPRYPGVVRHMRQLWPDPVTGGRWEVERDSRGGIRGVYSVSDKAPRKVSGFAPEEAHFEGALRYADWVFLARDEGAPFPLRKGRDGKSTERRNHP